MLIWNLCIIPEGLEAIAENQENRYKNETKSTDHRIEKESKWERNQAEEERKKLRPIIGKYVNFRKILLF